MVFRVTEEITAKLMESAYHKIERDGILATRLCTHKDDVELTNENKLKQLPGFTSFYFFRLLVGCNFSRIMSGIYLSERDTKMRDIEVTIGLSFIGWVVSGSLEEAAPNNGTTETPVLFLRILIVRAVLFCLCLSPFVVVLFICLTGVP